MKPFLSLCLLSLSVSYATHDTTFSLDRLESFYVEYLTEEKDVLAQAGLTSAAFGGNRLSPLPTPPQPFNVPIPQAPTSPLTSSTLLPVVISNTSGYADTDVYVYWQGRTPPNSGAQVFMQFDTNSSSSTFGQGTLVTATTLLNGNQYSYSLSQLPFADGVSGNRVMYIPEIDSGLLMISFNNKLNIPVVAAGISDPDFSNPNDPNYNTIWDQVEVNFDTSAVPQVVTDATAVSFFSIPLSVYLNGATSQNSSCGLTQSRSTIISYLNSCFSQVPSSPENEQWEKLTLYNTSGSALRVLSPGKSMAAGGFDMNYLDNKNAYLYSYLADIWYSAIGFYQDNTLSIEIPGGKIYSGRASGNTITLTSGADSVTLGPILSGPPYDSSTTWRIFSGKNIYSATTNDTDAIQVSKAFEEAIIAGIVPTTSLINASSLYTLSSFKPYYQINPNLSRFGQTKGPWYDLYSKALHACGLIYTYGYDEPLWPEVLLGGPYVQAPTSNFSYIGITILPSN